VWICEKISNSDHLRFACLPSMSHFLVAPMDTTTAYFTLFSTLLALKILILFPLCLYTMIVPPQDEEVEFPPPPGYSGTERKTIEVPKYPSFSDLLFLILVYAMDIVFIYPATRHGNEAQLNPALTAFLGGALALQAAAAVGWSGISMSWLAAEKKYGLWHYKTWSAYYMSFILVGVGIGLPLLFIWTWHVGTYAIVIAPTVGKAFYDAYAPLPYLYRRCIRLK